MKKRHGNEVVEYNFNEIAEGDIKLEVSEEDKVMDNENAPLATLEDKLEVVNPTNSDINKFEKEKTQTIIVNNYYNQAPIDGLTNQNNQVNTQNVNPKENINNNISNNVNNNGEKKLTQKEIIEREFLIREALIRNPFLFDNDINNNYILSIEDFYIVYKDESIRFGDCFREQAGVKRFNKFVRKRIISENFTLWKEEIDKRLENDELIGEGHFENVGKISSDFAKVKIYLFVLVIFSFFMCLFLLGEAFSFFGERNDLEKMVIGIMMALSIGCVLIGGLINKKKRMSTQFFKYGKGKYHKKIKALKKECDSKINEAIRYYSTAHKRRFSKKPLSISQVAIGEKRFLEIENIVNVNNEVNSNEKGKQGALKFFSRITKLFAILLPIASVIIFVIGIIRKFL